MSPTPDLNPKEKFWQALKKLLKMYAGKVNMNMNAVSYNMTKGL